MLATGKIKSRKLIPKTVFLTWRGSYKKVLRPEAIKKLHRSSFSFPH